MATVFHSILKQLFYGIIVRPILLIILGFNARHLDRLKVSGAHIVAANHNSHLDALVLMSLFKLSELSHVRVVAAQDYFCRTKFLAWFSVNVIGIIPINRAGNGGEDPVKPVIDALNENLTVIIFPEGSRGDPEQQAPLKYGISKVLEAKPQVQITPIYMHGLGKALPRGETLLVPFICDINVGKPLSWNGARTELIDHLQNSFDALKAEIEIKPWQ